MVLSSPDQTQIFPNHSLKSFKVDYTRVWMKLNCSIKGFSMRVFKWECCFSPQKESAIAPVWIRLEGVPLYMFDEASLLSLANAIGKPLRVHPSNLNREKLNSAKVCVELNVVEPRPDAIWVSFEDDFSKKPVDGFWVHVYYDVVPSFCIDCLHMGHRMDWCKRRTTSMNTRGKVLDKMPQPALTVNSLANLQGIASGAGPSKIENTWQVNKAGSGRDGVSVLGETTTQEMSRRGNSPDCAAGADCVVGQDCAITNVVQIVQFSNNSVEPARIIDRPAELVTAGQGFSTDSVAARKTGQSQEEHNTVVHQLLMTEENAGQPVEQDGTTDEEQSGGAVIVDEQHEMSTTTALLGIPSKAIAQAAGKMAEIHGDSSSVGFSTPGKGCIFTKLSTPSSWAD